MKYKSFLAVLAVAVSAIYPSVSTPASEFATRIVNYNPGTGFTAGYTNATSLLGAPSVITDDPQFGASDVDPMDPPYLPGQIVSIGAGGSITVGFDSPITHDASHPFGLDFLIFGHAAFDTAPNYDGIANGTIFGDYATAASVEVSSDGVSYYLLDPSKVPAIDALFPTDGAGNPGVPVDPSLNAAAFTGDDLNGVRAQYAGSAGGAGFSLAWALDSSSNAVSLASIQYVRITVLQGKADLDAIGSVMPPLPAPGGGWTEIFKDAPSLNSWKIFGDASLFRWDSTQENLYVTWDSSRPNSYFYRSLGAVLDRSSKFQLDFDLNLDDIEIGTESNKPSTFELSVGLIDFHDATNTAFYRGTGSSTPDIVEFDYFPDSGFGATIWPTITSSNDDYLALSYEIEPMHAGVTYHVNLSYNGPSNILTSVVTTNGGVFAAITNLEPVSVSAGFDVDTFAIESYSSAGQNPDYAGSLLAHGRIDNVEIAYQAIPKPRISPRHTPQGSSVQFTSATGYLYGLDRSTDLQTWSSITNGIAGTGATLSIIDNAPPANAAFYRITVRSP